MSKFPFIIRKLFSVFVVLLIALAAQTVRAQSYALTNLWSISPLTAAHPYVDTNNATRGMAFNHVSGNVIIPSRAGSNSVHIVNGSSGAKVGNLPHNVSLITGGTFPVNLAGVSDDGVIYVANLTTDTTSTNNASAGPLRVYRWSAENSQPELAYVGDPTQGNTVGTNPRRIGDSMAVRGAGANTQILFGTYNQLVYLLTTTDGTNFTAAKIQTDAVASDTRWGLAWGAGNTFWAKQSGGNLKQFSLDLAANTATTIASIPNFASVTGGPFAVDLSRNLLAIIDTTNHRLRLYDISILTDPLLMDSIKNFPTANANGNFTGAVAIRDGKLFALESNNGVMGFTLHEVFLPPTVASIGNVTVWDGAKNFPFTAGSVTGTRPFTYQWRFNGIDIPGETATTLIVTNISSAVAGTYSVVVSNTAGSATSAGGSLTVLPSSASSKMNNIWSLEPGTRPYLTSGYKEYGVAINPVNTNVIVLTRPNPTNMLVVLDPFTGAEKHHIDYSGLPLNGGTPMNKVDVADDGAIYIANYTGTPGTVPFTILGIGSDVPSTTDKWIAYTGNPGPSLPAGDNQWGRTLAARGSALNTELLVGSASSTARLVAIFRPDANYVFTPTFISVPDAPAGFCRLGIAWGPGSNTFWAKSLTSLILVEFDINAGTGFVRKSYPTTGLRSVPTSVTAISYDPVSKLLIGLQNGTAIRPVSVPTYDLTDLEAGPLELDLDLFTTYNADIEYQGQTDMSSGYAVALGVNNGLKMFKVNAAEPNLPYILSHPTGGTHYSTTSPTLSVIADSGSPLTYQWYRNGSALPDATTANLTLANIQLADAGAYYVRVSNTGGSRDSALVTINVIEVFNTSISTNTWSLQPDSRPYLTTNYKQYGMAFNPATSNLLLSSLEGGTFVAVLDALTGQEKHFLNVNGIAGGTKVLHKIDVAEDGAVYAGNLTTAATGNPFILYRWSNDSGSTIPTVAYSGDPGSTESPNGAFGYTLDVRGSSSSTEVLLGATASNVVSVLKTADGSTFTANAIKVIGAPSGFARLGIAFGAGNTFWAKPAAGTLRLVEYDLAAGTGTILKTYSLNEFPGEITALDYHEGRKYLAALANETPKNVRIYDVDDLEAGPQLLDQELFPTANPSIDWNGEIDFADNYLFALDPNNGIHAYLLEGSTPTSLRVLGITAVNGTITIEWQAQSGTTYDVQAVETLSSTWQNIGSPVTANGSTASFVDTVPAGVTQRFYRIVSQ